MNDQHDEIIIDENECADVQTIPYLELNASLVLSEALGDLESVNRENPVEKVTTCVSLATLLEDPLVQNLNQSMPIFDEFEFQQESSSFFDLLIDTNDSDLEA